MAESIFPSLRIALNQAWGGVRSKFGRLTPPAKQQFPEADGFLNRLEEVLGIELQEVEPVLEEAEFVEPVFVAERFVHTEPVAPRVVALKPKRNASKKDIARKAMAQKPLDTTASAGNAAATKVATGKKRTGRSGSRRKSGKTTKVTAAK